jgi:DNA repair protein RecO (recombination protein O)
MLVKTTGIIFRAVKYSETSIITDIYTRELGLQTYIVNGVRSARSKTGAAQFQIMSLADVVAYHRDDRKMHRVKEIRAAYVYQRLPFDVRRSAVGLFMAEIARKTIRESEQNGPLFDFLFDSFCFLDSTEEPFANLHLNFLIGLSAHLGFLPGGDFTAETPVFDMQEGIFTHQAAHAHCMDEEQSLLLYQLLCCDREQCHIVAMQPSQRRRLLQSLLTFYRLHIESLPEIHSHEILHEVFE